MPLNEGAGWGQHRSPSQHAKGRDLRGILRFLAAAASGGEGGAWSTTAGGPGECHRHGFRCRSPLHMLRPFTGTGSRGSVLRVACVTRSSAKAPSRDWMRHPNQTCRASAQSDAAICVVRRASGASHLAPLVTELPEECENSPASGRRQPGEGQTKREHPPFALPTRVRCISSLPFLTKRPIRRGTEEFRYFTGRKDGRVEGIWGQGPQMLRGDAGNDHGCQV
jgi:hypothetical protein